MSIDPQKLGDEFEDQVRSAGITGSSEVVLILRREDLDGKRLPDIRESVVPRTTVGGFPPGMAALFAATLHLDTIVGNIRSKLESMAEEAVEWRGHPGQRFRVTGADLEITP